MSIPSPCAYLHDVAGAFASDDLRVLHTAKLILDHFTPEQLVRLSSAYEEIRARGDTEAISRWIDEHSRDNVHAHDVNLLLLVFELLGKRGVMPFADGEVCYLAADPELDWSILPPELHYVIEAAERYGRIQFRDEIDEFAASMTAEQREELQAVAARSDGDMHLFVEWISRHDDVRRPEVDRIHFLFILLGELGMF